MLWCRRQTDLKGPDLYRVPLRHIVHLSVGIAFGDEQGETGHDADLLHHQLDGARTHIIARLEQRVLVHDEGEGRT